MVTLTGLNTSSSSSSLQIIGIKLISEIHVINMIVNDPFARRFEPRRQQIYKITLYNIIIVNKIFGSQIHSLKYVKTNLKLVCYFSLFLHKCNKIKGTF